jgi:hypothetical protein
MRRNGIMVDRRPRYRHHAHFLSTSTPLLHVDLRFLYYSGGPQDSVGLLRRHSPLFVATRQELGKVEVPIASPKAFLPSAAGCNGR